MGRFWIQIVVQVPFDGSKRVFTQQEIYNNNLILKIIGAPEKNALIGKTEVL